MKIAIVGGGAAGMAAAISAADKGAAVTIFEHMPRMGKKLLLTGSGKCNLSNSDMDISHFHGSGKCGSLISSVFDFVNPNEMLSFFNKKGLVTRERNGYIYPYCEQASAVMDVLRFAVRDRNIQVFTDCNVKSIAYNNLTFILSTTEGREYCFDRVVLAAGSKAYKNTGSDGSGYSMAASLGHRIVKPLPALTHLNCEESFFPSIAGIRTHGKVTIGSKSETGEIQLTKTGISGIPVFNLSYLAAKSLDLGEKVSARIDFLPEMSADDLMSLLKSRRMSLSSRPLDEFLLGILHKNLSNLILKECNLKDSLKIECGSISDDVLKEIACKLKDFVVNVKSCGNFDNAQVCSGGIDINDVTENLESKYVKGLFFAGEILDINGDCGGYNLTWAFCSGIAAGNFAAG